MPAKNLTLVEVEWDDLEMEKDGVRIVWTYCDEGISGDYGPEDSEDEPRLRADITVLRDEHESDVMSYCTLAPVATSEAELRRMLDDLVGAIYSDPFNVKTVVERWTHRTRPNDLGEL